MKAAMKAGYPVSVDIKPTLADGLAVPMVGYNAFATVQPLMDKLVRNYRSLWFQVGHVRIV